MTVSLTQHYCQLDLVVSACIRARGIAQTGQVLRSARHNVFVQAKLMRLQQRQYLET